jgi:hypothetical protein
MTEEEVFNAEIAEFAAQILSDPSLLRPFQRPKGVDELIKGVDLDGWLEA